MRCLNSKWSFIKKYGLAFLCGGVAWMLIDVSVTKGIDASFVSACMDTVMAGVACIAGYKAKRIWDEKIAEDSYKNIKSTYKDIIKGDPSLDLMNSSLKEIKSYVSSYSSDFSPGDGFYLNGDFFDQKENEIISRAGYFHHIYSNSKFFNINIVPLFKVYSNRIENNLLDFKIVGGFVERNTIISSYLEHVDEINSILKDFLNEVDVVYSSVGASIYNEHDEILYNEKINTNSIFNKDISKINKKLTALINSVDSLSKCQQLLSDDDYKMTDFFKIKI